MKYALVFSIALALCPAWAAAQEESAVGTVEPAEPAATDTATAEEAEAKKDSDEDERGPYYKKVQGLLWLEFLAGPTSFDPTKYGTLSLGGQTIQATKDNGAEWGFAIGVGLGGFHLGAFYRQAQYDGYKLLRVGLDMKGIFRFIPYVHPMIRIDLYYAGIVDGAAFSTTQLTNFDADGGGFTLGAGVMIPIVRWMSFTATFDWSVMGLAVRADQPGGERVSGGIAGQQLGATFALTFHFIGVRRNN
ncbi:MAG: hypothetical protein AAF997_00965 [Myxococcota bacterium]